MVELSNCNRNCLASKPKMFTNWPMKKAHLVYLFSSVTVRETEGQRRGMELS